MAKRLAELGALQDAVSNNESNPSRLGLAGYIRGLFLDWSANPYNPLTRLSARGRLLGYFWDNGAIGLSMDFANQNFIVKDGTLQSKPFSDIVNFTRTTNATVTNSAGVITYAPHNLLTYSEQFDNAAWVKTRATITSNSAVSPNGTTTMDKLIETAVAGTHYVNFSYTNLASTNYTASIYLKAGERTKAQLSIISPTSTFEEVKVTIDLTAGTIGTPTAINGAAVVGGTITNEGNGIYRVSLSGNIGTKTNMDVRVWLLDNTGTISYTGDGTSGLLVWGAQLEVGASPTAYNPTTVKNLLGYSELFDNAAWTKSNSFVQTNLLTYSEALDNAAWTVSNATLGSNNVIAPNGYSTADTVTLSGGDNVLRTSQTSITNSIPYTQSIYVKKNNFDWVRFVVSELSNQVNSIRVWFNMATGVVGSNATTGVGYTYISSAITNAGNGWYRISITYSTSLSVSLLLLASADADASTARATTGSSYYLWGAQLVQGATAGDYRRTDAAALPTYYANHNGVVCAEKLVENAATSEHRIQVTPTLGTAPITASIYFKASERSWAFIRLDDSISVKYAYFNLSTGVVGTVTAGLTASIVNAGNGWYRCSAKFNAPSAGSGGILFAPTTGNGTSSYTGDGTSGIYIFGAQLSDSASLDPYILNAAAAPSAAAYYGARFDYDPVTLAPKGLLIEEQRANLLLNSSLAGTNLATQSVTVTAVAHTLSFYGTGTVTLTGTAIATAVGDGAYPTRKTLTFTPTAGAVLFTVTGTVQYAQLEIGSFATSFIPTAASQVTRTADVASIQGSNFYSWYNQNEGSIFANAVSYGTSGGGASVFWSVSDNTLNNRMRFSSTGGVFDGSTNGTSQFSISQTYAYGGYAKVASAYKINSFSSAINNTLGTEDTSGTTAIVTQMQIGNLLTTRDLSGHIKQISYYPQRLSNDVLKGLTA